LKLLLSSSSDVSVFGIHFIEKEETSIQGDTITTRPYLKIEYNFWEVAVGLESPINSNNMIVYKEEYISLIRQKKMKLLGI
jgi:hypothetical protein